MPMPGCQRSPHRRAKPDRRALELLAGCGAEGCAEGIKRAHAFFVACTRQRQPIERRRA
jgi:hypothetical protein